MPTNAKNKRLHDRLLESIPAFRGILLPSVRVHGKCASRSERCTCVMQMYSRQTLTERSWPRVIALTRVTLDDEQSSGRRQLFSLPPSSDKQEVEVCRGRVLGWISNASCTCTCNTWAREIKERNWFLNSTPLTHDEDGSNKRFKKSSISYN